MLLIALTVIADPLEIAFESNPSRGAILVKGMANGKPAQFLLDTGAAHTVLGAHIVGVSAMDLKLARFASEGPGLSGEALWHAANLKLGARRWDNRTIVVMNLQSLGKIYGRRIDGILGQDLLAEFSRVTIDFKRRRILLEE